MVTLWSGKERGGSEQYEVRMRGARAKDVVTESFVSGREVRVTGGRNE
jgi:hypothetical protein